MPKLQIPNSWGSAKVAEVVRVEYGKGLPERDRKKGEVRVIASGGVVGSHNQFLYNQPTVVTGRKGSIGAVHFVEGKSWVIDTAYALLASEVLNPKFLYWRLKGFDFSSIEASTAIPSVSREALYKIELPIPPLGEQGRIVAKIESTRSKINAIEASVSSAEDLIEKYREALLQKAFRGELVPQNPNDEPASKLIERIRAERAELSKSGKKQKDELPRIKPEEIPFEIPRSWQWVRLGEISDVVRGGSPRPAGDKKFYGGDIPFLHVSDLTREPSINVTKFAYTIKPAGLVKTRLVEANTLMLTNSGATLGVPRIVRFKATFNDGVAAFLGLSDSISKEFLCLYLTTLTKQMLKQAYASGSQGQPNLNTGLISNTPVPIPSFNEQLEIVQKIQADLGKIQSLGDSFESLRCLAEDSASAILEFAFSGRLVSQCASDGTGNELLAQILRTDEAAQTSKSVHPAGKIIGKNKTRKET